MSNVSLESARQQSSYCKKNTTHDFTCGFPNESHVEVLSLQPIIPPKRFDISPPDWGMLRRSRHAFRFFFKQFIPAGIRWLVRNKQLLYSTTGATGKVEKPSVTTCGLVYCL